MAPHDELDPLAELMSGVALPTADPAHRAATFARTCAVLRQRRFVRRSAWVAALAACYVVGALSVVAWQSAWPSPSLAERPPAVLDGQQPTATQDAKLPAAPEPTPSRDKPPPAVAPVAVAVELTTFEKMRRAGDRQLNERGNLQGALGCYRRALDFASDADLQIVPERDSWLLIPLKEARLEARKNVPRKS